MNNSIVLFDGLLRGEVLVAGLTWKPVEHGQFLMFYIKNYFFKQTIMKINSGDLKIFPTNLKTRQV
jgi:hypothetical protein